MSAAGIVHTACAVWSLGLGLAVFCMVKGTRAHRVAGVLYALGLVGLNVTALSIFELTGGPGAFHVLAAISLATLAAGVLPASVRRPRRGWLDLHAYFMSWSYVGLVAAGVAQIATHVLPWEPALAVGLPSFAVVLVGAVFIHTRVPRAVVGLRATSAPPGSAPFARSRCAASR